MRVNGLCELLFPNPKTLLRNIGHNLLFIKSRDEENKIDPGMKRLVSMFSEELEKSVVDNQVQKSYQ